jgi:hypothetical protein
MVQLTMLWDKALVYVKFHMGIGWDFNGQGVYVTNTTYAYNSMRDGDMFAKKFGGPTGNDPDWYKLLH